MKMCRACLSSPKELLKLNEACLKNYNLLTDLAITLGDGLPQHLCRNCWVNIEYFIEFRNKCLHSESSLAAISKNIKTEDIEGGLDTKSTADLSESFTIKEELVEDHFDEVLNICSKSDILKLEKSEDVCQRTRQTKKRRCSQRNKDTEKKRNKKETELPKDKSSKLKTNSSSGNALACGLCPKAFENREELSLHLEEHKTEKICLICSESFEEWPQLLGHRSAHLSGPSVQCHVCGARLARKEAHVEYHYLKLHYDREFPGLRCRLCPRAFDSPLKLRKHVWGIHSAKRLFCDICSKEFHNKQHLAGHLRGHSSTKSCACDLCDFRCKLPSGLTAHKLRAHSATRHQCARCKRLFSSPALLQRHAARTAQCAVSAVCAVCGRTFPTGSALSRHQRTHSAERRYACARCPATYRSRLGLTEHARRHERRRSERCDLCPAAFYSRTVLVRHRRVHTGERPYVCGSCGKGFTSNYNLKVHMKVHGEMLIRQRAPETSTARFLPK